MISPTGRLACSSVLVAIATLGVMLATEPQMAIVWDEGYTLGREARLRDVVPSSSRSRRVRLPMEPAPAHPGAGPAGRSTASSARADRHPVQVALRSPRPGLLLALRSRGAPRPPPLLRPARPRGRPGGSLLAGSASRTPGPDSSLQPYGRSPFQRSCPAMGRHGPQSPASERGSSSPTSSATATTRPTMPFSVRSGFSPSCSSPARRSRQAQEVEPRGAGGPLRDSVWRSAAHLRPS